jgi:DNA-directed RNA polymerase subunit RPC12/RpoP
MTKINNVPAWPSNSEATRSLRQKSWTVVLRCFRCKRNFAVRKVPLERLAMAPQVMPCRHCGAQPSLSAQPHVHKIADMRDDSNDGGSPFDPSA